MAPELRQVLEEYDILFDGGKRVQLINRRTVMQAYVRLPVDRRGPHVREAAQDPPCHGGKTRAVQAVRLGTTESAGDVVARTGPQVRTRWPRETTA